MRRSSSSLQRRLDERPAPEQAEREREEDGDDRDDVVPERDHTRSRSSNSHWRNCSNSWITYSRSGGENEITIDHRHDRAADQQERVARAEPRRVHAGDALRVHQDLADPQADEERARHPLAALVEELAEVPVRAHRHDRLGALLVREQERDVLARPRRLDDAVGTPSASSRCRPGARPSGYACSTSSGGRVAGGTSRAVAARARLQRRVRDAVHVADDQVGAVARLEQGVRAAVDADQHRPDVADVPAERGQVLLVVVAADDDEDRAPAQVVRRAPGDPGRRRAGRARAA